MNDNDRQDDTLPGIGLQRQAPKLAVVPAPATPPAPPPLPPAQPQPAAGVHPAWMWVSLGGILLSAASAAADLFDPKLAGPLHQALELYHRVFGG